MEKSITVQDLMLYFEQLDDTKKQYILAISQAFIFAQKTEAAKNDEKLNKHTKSYS